jgi:PAS domain S-box-containing protein
MTVLGQPPRITEARFLITKGNTVEDEHKTREQLICELLELRRRFTELELSISSSMGKDYLEKIINSISDPIFIKDSKHRLVLVNDAECRLVGCSREELIGKTDYDFFPKDHVDMFWRRDDEVLDTGIENINEEEITDANGEKRTIVNKKTLYIDETGNRFIVGIIRDVTTRKHAEKLLREAHNKLEISLKERTAELEKINKQLQAEIIERNRIVCTSIRHSNVPAGTVVKSSREKN